jgi:hypothetical protein
LASGIADALPLHMLLAMIPGLVAIGLFVGTLTLKRAPRT